MLPPGHAERLARARVALDGLSVGDAFGERFFTHPDLVGQLIAARAIPRAPWGYTDDTEMALGIEEVLGRRGTIDQSELAATFGRRYLQNPHRGYGGMAHQILAQLALPGTSWRAVSGAVFEGTGSKGNGAAMRVAPLGAYFAEDLPRVSLEARLSAEVTHLHPEGIAGAIAVAIAAALATRPRVDTHDPPWATILEHTPESETRGGIVRAAELPFATSPERAAEALGSGARVLAEDTVPFALWCAARHPDHFVEGLWCTVAGLGDRDTTCAIAGGIIALSAGRAAIPPEWRAAREPLAFG